MTGILERIEAKLDQLLEGGGAATPAAKGGATKAPAKAKVSYEELTTIVQPMTQKEEDKKKVKACLSGFGLNRLSDATEEQYAPLKEAFEKLAEELAAGGDDDDLI